MFNLLPVFFKRKLILCRRSFKRGMPTAWVHSNGGDVAQLGERHVRNVEAAGSIPAISTSYQAEYLKTLNSTQVSRMGRAVLSKFFLSLSLIVICFGCAPHQAFQPEAGSGVVTAQQDDAQDLARIQPKDEEIVCIPSQTEEQGEDALIHQDEAVQEEEEAQDTASGHAEEDNKAQAVSQQELLDAALDYCKASQDLWSQGRLDRAIEALDHAYDLILKVDSDDNPDLVQQKEDLRFMISKRILEIHASRHTAVVGNSEAIPLVMNRHVEYEIKRFQGVERKFFIDSYRRSGKYRPYIVKVLKDVGLPEDLSWLPLIESGFKVRALSRARALGLWQFIPSTGYKFGLNRDAWIDERLDPEKSTRAAIEYLKELHGIFGDWTTVLAAYNCGEGTVLRLIRHQRINYLDNFWDLYEKLPRETARYVPRFLAILHIIKDPEKYGFSLSELDSPIPYETVTVSKQLHLRTVSSVLNVPFKELRELNPELRYQVTPASVYPLRVPAGKGKLLMAKLPEISPWCPPKRAYVYHRVKKGETLSLIAMKYHTTVRQIARANNLHTRHFIRVGQKLKVPLRTRATRFAAGAKPRSDGTYVVKRGDSLWLIARRFKTTQRAIMAQNGLLTTTLYQGQLLKIPGYQGKTKKTGRRSSGQTNVIEASTQRLYRVKPGDNPSYIAQKLRIPLSKLLRLNNLGQDATIYPGQVLVVQ